MELKAGVKTSEFYLTVITMAAGIAEMITMPSWAYAVLPGLYAIARGWAKKQ